MNIPIPREVLEQASRAMCACQGTLGAAANLPGISLEQLKQIEQVIRSTSRALTALNRAIDAAEKREANEEAFTE